MWGAAGSYGRAARRARARDAAATNSALTTQTKTLSASDALPLREEIAALLKKRGADVKVR